MFATTDAQGAVLTRRRIIIRVSDFLTIFRESGVRSWFDWDLLRLPEYAVIETFSRSKAILGSLETVWYASPDRSLGDWRDQGNRRLRVEEAAPMTNFPSKSSNDYIEQLASGMRSSPTPPYLVFPCYRTQQGKMLILDGNHRAIAAFKSGTNLRLLIFAITGPDNPFMLPDLMHETASDLTPGAWAQRCTEIEEKFKKNSSRNREPVIGAADPVRAKVAGGGAHTCLKTGIP